MAVDPDTGEILASEPTIMQDGDASLVGPLLDQIKRLIITGRVWAPLSSRRTETLTH